VYDFDLARMDLDQYKVVVFMNVYYVSPERRRIIQEKVCQNTRTVVWNYLTGFTDGETIDIKNTEELTGILLQRAPEFETQTVAPMKAPLRPFAVVRDLVASPVTHAPAGNLITAAKKTTPNYTSLIYTIPLSKQTEFREIFRTAGCHIYNETGDVIYENSGLLLFHTATAGTHSVTLRNGKVITLTTTGAATKVLDAETGETVL
jgi:hypothetical protein